MSSPVPASSCAAWSRTTDWERALRPVEPGSRPDGLRKLGWQVPAYTLPANLESTAVLRIVVRNGFSRDLADLLLADIEREVRQLSAVTAPLPQHPDRTAFSH